MLTRSLDNLRKVNADIVTSTTFSGVYLDNIEDYALGLNVSYLNLNSLCNDTITKLGNHETLNGVSVSVVDGKAGALGASVSNIQTNSNFLQMKLMLSF